MESFRKGVLRHSTLFPASGDVLPHQLRQIQGRPCSHSTLLFGMEAYLAKEETQTKFEERLLDLKPITCKRSTRMCEDDSKKVWICGTNFNEVGSPNRHAISKEGYDELEG